MYNIMKHVKLFEDFCISEKKKDEKWIQDTHIKKGALKGMLGYESDEHIPAGILKKICDAEVGSKIKANGEDHIITAKMKKRANLAKEFKSFKK